MERRNGENVLELSIVETETGNLYIIMPVPGSVSGRLRQGDNGGTPPDTLRVSRAYFFGPDVPLPTATVIDAVLFAVFGSPASAVTVAVFVIVVLPRMITVTLICADS